MAEVTKEEVTESEDFVEIPPPSGEYTHLTPFKFLDKDDHSNTALIILNQKFENITLTKVWSSTVLNVCADGGANRLFECFESEEVRSRFIPHFIVGDLDSIRPDVQAYYETKGTTVILQTSQYATDFTKAIILTKIYLHSSEGKAFLKQGPIESECGLLEYSRNKNITNESVINLYALGGIDGRFDQTISSINQLYKLNVSDPNINLYFLTDCDLIFLLRAGTNYVGYESKSIFNTSAKLPICGLLPLGSNQVCITTKGLKYDVKDWKTDMTGKVSSSNAISGVKGFIVESDHPIIMNIEVDFS
ncbi:Piso0_000918 [Millerozyma farinosa CBS 7064]|uniref:Thiamine pyrophosphokinase n=1 Tax=Pichia sorbitophila (strain ATCC MYA-4447 / BCRC 22081 / CBS 7064 / NBRC 10061 / NRRL Y-12695) TaxID=559304 RepID=G8YQE9_PICSO|nr:Piso0_000918 [Millerozyma farinosa CBS 7064]